MAANNLRIIHNNIADTATTITASSSASTATTVSNLIKNTKSQVWRSSPSTTSAVSVKLVVTLSASAAIGGVVLPFTNLTSAATIRVRGYTGTVPTLGGTVDVPTFSALGTLTFDSGVILACPYAGSVYVNPLNIPAGTSKYSYGGGNYARVWLPAKTACTSLLIEITDTNTNRYVELSRLVIGNYWSPVYNTSYGLSATIKDLTTQERSESGDLISNRGVSFNSLNFNLDWLTTADRLVFASILKNNGMYEPLLISLFPDNSTDYGKEQAHQIYGKLSQLSAISNPYLSYYSSSVDIEEI